VRGRNLRGMGDLGRVIVGLGVLLIVLGAAMMLVGKVPWIGHLPGDIHIERERFSFHFPLVTCLVVSVVLSLVLNFIFRR
jgi:ribose/xylose/arabinose/galactoside ABC-type transport system permease subunit